MEGEAKREFIRTQSNPGFQLFSPCLCGEFISSRVLPTFAYVVVRLFPTLLQNLKPQKSRPPVLRVSLCASWFILFQPMDIIALTRQLVDIESITGNEATVGHFLEQELRKLGYDSRRMLVEGDRTNVWATSPQAPNPAIVFSTHMDTVPPFIPSSEDDDKIYGR